MIFHDFPPEISGWRLAVPVGGPEKPTEVEGLKSLESLGEGEGEEQRSFKPQEMGGSEGTDG